MGSWRMTPEVHADVAGVAKGNGLEVVRLFWRVPAEREEPKPGGPALACARGSAH
jgi:hypothetical protein